VNDDPVCLTEGCGHRRKLHRDAEDAEGRWCRVTGCPCEDFLAKEEPPGEPKVRRISVDVPDGYTITISLIPWDPDQPVLEVPVGS
jgi:hypothetical protein